MADQPLERHIKTLEKSISQSGHFTLEDAASITGIAVEDARKALDALMVKYRTKLKLTDEGVLIYDFGKDPVRRGVKTFAEKWADVKAQAWRVFKFLFKIWIAATLVVYFFIFLVILIAVLVGLMSGGKNKRGNGRAAGRLIESVTNMFLHIFRWNTRSGTIIHERDWKGYPYPEYEKHDSEWDKVTQPKVKSFVGSIYDFVFGPPRIDVSDLSNQKEVAAYLRKKDGIIVLPEMKALAGWDSEQADDFFTDCIVRFNGEAKISDDGVLYGDFQNLLRSVEQRTDARVEWFWDEYEPEYKVTGNTKTRNFLILGMAAFNLIGSLWVLNYLHSADSAIDLPASGAADLLLGWFPLIFSFIFLFVPAWRSFGVRRQNRKRGIRNIRKRLMNAVYNAHRNELSSEELVEAANNTEKGEDRLSKNDVEQVMNRFIADWDGEVDATEDGRVIYRFPRLKEELEAAERLRKTLDRGDMGKVIVRTQT